MRGTELVVTANQDGERTQIGAYGSKTTAIVSGILGDLFNIIRQELNFTFILKPPPDGKFGGKFLSAPKGWKGMVGLIAEGKADMSLTPLTVTEDRSTVVYFTTGCIVVEKMFFIGNTAC